MTVETQLREYRATLDGATEARAESHADPVAPVIRIRPTRSLLLAAVAVAAVIAVAFAAIGTTRDRSTPPVGTTPDPRFLGSRTVVPDVVGLKGSDAVGALDRLGFRPVSVYLQDCTAAAGIVVSTNPPAGTHIAAASAVVIRVCTHARPPDVTGPTMPPSQGWTSRQLFISPNWLGQVGVGMTKQEAEAVAGYAFDGSGDGFAYPTQLPAGYPHDYVGLGGYGDTVDCVGAALVDPTGDPPDPAQDISTGDGFHLGDTVEHLLALYGSRPRFMPAPASGMTTNAGYVVEESGGNLVFVVDRANKRVVEIAGGGPDLGPNSCTG